MKSLQDALKLANMEVLRLKTENETLRMAAKWSSRGGRGGVNTQSDGFYGQHQERGL